MRVSNEFLSNYYMCTVKIDGVTFPSVEHAYQACKCAPDDSKSRRIIRECHSVYMARQLGSLINVRSDWEDIRESVMMECIHSKFALNPELQDDLLDMSNDYLVAHTNELSNFLINVRDEIVGNINVRAKLAHAEDIYERGITCEGE